MQKFWRWLAVYLGKNAGLISGVTLILTAVLGYGITKLEFATGQDSYLDPKDPIAIENVKYQDLFGGQAMVTLITLDEGEDMMEYLVGKNADKIQATVDKLRKVPNTLAVVDPLSVVRFSSEIAIGPDTGEAKSVADAAASVGGSATLDALTRTQEMAAAETDPDRKAELEESVELRTADLGANQARLQAIPPEEWDLDNPEWVRFLLSGNDGKIRPAVAAFFPDDRHIQIISRLEGNMSIADEGASAQGVVEATKDLSFENAEVITTGAPVLIDEINSYLQSGMLTLGAIAMGIMVVILAIFFDVRWRLLPLLVVAIGVVWAFGLAGYIGIPLNLVTIAGLPVMLGVGIDYAIQMQARIEEEVIVDRSKHPIQETARNLGPALLVVTFDAVFAFLALRWAKAPMIRDFGTLLAVGVAVICLCSIITPLAWLGMREYRKPTTGRDFRDGVLGKIVVKLGDLPGNAAIPLAVASVLIFFGGVSVESKLEIQTDPEKWVNQSSEVLGDLTTLSDETGASSEMGVYIRSKDQFSQDTINVVHQLTRNFVSKYGSDEYDRLIPRGNSFVSVVADTIAVPGALDLPPLAEHVKASYDLAEEGGSTEAIADVTTADGAHNIILQTGPSNLKERAVVVEEILDTVDGQIEELAGPDSGISATPSGLAVVGVGLLNNLEKGRILLTYLAILFVFLFLLVRLRSLARSLLSLVPVLIAVGATSIVAWVAGLQLSPMTAVGGPLVVAVCTEFTSLILLRFVEERHRGFPAKEAVDITAARTGRAFMVSGMTAIAGVLVIASSPMPLLRDFGLIVGMNVAVALISALVVLPPMLVWADEPGREWVSKGLVPEEDLAKSRNLPPNLPDLATPDGETISDAMESANASVLATSPGTDRDGARRDAADPEAG